MKDNVITTQERQRLLKDIRQYTNSHPHKNINESTSVPMWFGRVFQKDHYGSSRRKVISGQEVNDFLPNLRSLYYRLTPLVSGMVGVDVYPCEPRNSVCLMVLLYQDEGDIIAPHFDHCYFRPDQLIVTALLCLENTSDQTFCVGADTRIVSDDAYSTRTEADGMHCLDILPGRLLLVSHYDTLHGIRPPLKQGHSRVVMSMIFAQHPYTTTVKDAIWEVTKADSVVGRMPTSFIVFWSTVFVLLVLFIVIVIVLLRRKRRTTKAKKSTINKNKKIRDAA